MLRGKSLRSLNRLLEKAGSEYRIPSHSLIYLRTSAVDAIMSKAEAFFYLAVSAVAASDSNCVVDGSTSKKEMLSDSLAAMMSAVKMSPRTVKAWNTAGECLWHMGDIKGAYECFASSLSQLENAEAYRLQSMALRKMGTTSQEKVENMTKSIQLAKKALALDFSDGESWYMMGNTYLACFFALSHQTRGQDDLRNAIKAYNRAEVAMKAAGRINADMYFNRGQVHRFLQMYEEAIHDYDAVTMLQPTHEDARAQLAALRRSIARVADLVSRKGKMKAKKLSALAQGLRRACDEANEGNSGCVVSDLAEGENPGKAVAFKVLMPLNSTNDPPATLLALDASGAVCALSVYHIDVNVCGTLRERDTIVVRDPAKRTVRCVGGESATYALVQARLPTQFSVNGQQLKQKFAHATLATSTS